MREHLLQKIIVNIERLLKQFLSKRVMKRRIRQSIQKDRKETRDAKPKF